jgi:hypothetical protein
MFWQPTQPPVQWVPMVLSPRVKRGRGVKLTIIALMMEAVFISETSVHFNVTTRRYSPEDSELQTRRRENLKSHKSNAV